MQTVKLLRHFILIGLALLLATAALAQQGQSSVRGRVIDDTGGVLPGVTIVVTNEATGIFREVVSNADGSYFVTGIVPGRYRMAAELSGFKRYERTGVILEIGTTASIDITLEVGVLEETVTVTAGSPLVDLTSAQVGGNITNEELIELPSQGRNWLQFVGLLPGIQVQASTASFGCESFIVSGQSNRSGNFSIDGGGNNDDFLGQACGSQTRTAVESVQEYQVLTNQFDAEFGRTAGAVVNAITKQGSNLFRGSGTITATDSSITAADFFVAQRNIAKPETSKKEIAATLGGPVVRDKAHFFYGMERILFDEGRSNTFDARPELNFATAQEMRLWNHMMRFDQQISNDHTWTVRHMREHSPLFGRISGRRTLAAADQEFDIDHTTVANWNAVFGANRFNTVRVGWTYEKNGFTAREVQEEGAALVDLPPSFQMLTFLDGIASGGLFRINNSYEIGDSFSWFIPETFGGDNDLKFGAQYIYSTIELPNQSTMNGLFRFNTDQPFNAADPRTYPERLDVRVPAPSDPYVPTHVMALYAQDKWQRGNLTLNLGVRYDLEIQPLSHANNPLFAPGEYAVDKNNVAPRLGFAYNPGGSGLSVIRGGYGIFYEKIHLRTITQFVTDSVFSDSFIVQFPADRADPGPSRGQFPTDPMLVNGPTVNRALLNQLFPPGSLARNGGTVYLDDPNRVVPNTAQATLGWERQLAAQLSFSADYIHSWNRDLLLNYELNPGLRVDTSRTGRIVRTDLLGIASQRGLSPFATRVITRRNLGDSEYDGVNMMLEKRFSDGWAARVSYGLGYSRGNAEADQTSDNVFQLLDDPRLDLNEGPTNNDRRHNVVISGRIEVPRTGGLTISGVWRYMTGAAFSLYNSAVDADRNGFLFDPLPPGTYSGVGQNAITVENDGGPNGAYGPSFQQTDMRFGYRIRPASTQTLDLYAEVFNLFNNANFSNPTGDMRLTDFLVVTALRGGSGFPRQLQFGARFGF